MLLSEVPPRSEDCVLGAKSCHAAHAYSYIPSVEQTAFFILSFQSNSKSCYMNRCKMYAYNSLAALAWKKRRQ
eukprot:6177869-Pleurochrysis_carterae.AAC.1